MHIAFQFILALVFREFVEALGLSVFVHVVPHEQKGKRRLFEVQIHLPVSKVVTRICDNFEVADSIALQTLMIPASSVRKDRKDKFIMELALLLLSEN